MACPICGEDTVRAYRPFCSKRCADIDLGRWMQERYVVPGREGEEEGVPEDDAPDQIQ
ncbi:DNA gyrase inhibitor YacG [Pseudaestuariivita sp.]|uniref:DNA gyrase inhibitor YacG n=1 Tax=Pseudaestuariivita sp. TaxID=2211669 RepID=UPI004058CF54